MPHYYFDIKDGHRLVDSSGLDFKNDDAAIARRRLSLSEFLSINQQSIRNDTLLF
jgi:hypothetical protein